MRHDSESSSSSPAIRGIRRYAGRLLAAAALLSVVGVAGLASSSVAYADDDDHDRDRRRVSRNVYSPPDLQVEVKARVGRDGKQDGYDGREFAWRITVENDGDTPTAPFWLHYYLNQAPGHAFPQFVGALAPGKRVTFTVDLGPCVSWNNIYVVVDPFREVPETNEANNERYEASDACIERDRRDRDRDDWW